MTLTSRGEFIKVLNRYVGLDHFQSGLGGTNEQLVELKDLLKVPLVHDKHAPVAAEAVDTVVEEKEVVFVSVVLSLLQYHPEQRRPRQLALGCVGAEEVDRLPAFGLDENHIEPQSRDEVFILSEH